MISINLLYRKDSYLYKQEMFKHFKYQHIIDYNSIISKLMKKDGLKTRPNELIVSLEIYKDLEKIFSKKQPQLVLHILKNLNIKVISSIIIVLDELSKQHDIPYELSLSVTDPKILNNEEIRSKIAIFLYNEEEDREL